MMIAALWILGAYLVGSVPFSYLIVRRLQHRDIRTLGSGNPGATNVLRAAGRRPAAAALVLDLLKGVAPVVAARQGGVPDPILGGVAVAAVAGHVFPVFLGFRGGKGVATAAGALGALAPLVAAAASLVFLLVVTATRYVSLGSIAAAALFPALVLLFGALGWIPGGPWTVAAAVAIAALVVGRHRGNLRRLLAGTEPKLGQRAGGGDR